MLPLTKPMQSNVVPLNGRVRAVIDSIAADVKAAQRATSGAFCTDYGVEQIQALVLKLRQAASDLEWNL